MTQLREIRADYDAAGIVLYQAYAPAIAGPAVAANRFVAPFSRGRMTWIKPSFRWLMHRSNWGQKPGQTCVLAVRISRAGWEQALARAVPTTADPAAVERAAVHVQWDPERSLSGAALNHYSIQVGVGRGLIDAFADEWTISITDLTPRVRRIAELVRSGRASQAARLLPPERPYPLNPSLARELAIG
ncbi:DUF4291 domain-containing protein [Kitasatospora mediocidica]|uniref:DUF4291 domain-containing protein n=1 Tax=Kitasatospora mediocidica TaxID=58352 RepID=UPI000564CB4C|nr:DUF4291 domain-containing protein [Kitasatospora mediocidica]